MSSSSSSSSSSQQQVRRKPGQSTSKGKAAPAPAESVSAESSTTATTHGANDAFTHLIVLDFEAQCRDRPEPTPRPQEIVEFPCVVVDIKKRAIVDEFHTFVKPTVHAQIFPFTTQLTGVTQENVDGGVEIDEAMSRADAFIAKYDTDTDESHFRALIVTCGHWDLRTALPNECKFKKLTIPRAFRSWCNIKILFQARYGLPKQLGMDGMLRQLKMALVGRHHSGIDDARNIARIAIRMLEDGVSFEPNGS
jgi:inhibitor of KinA sporulation pathway (predicted exonuclease)